MRPDALERCAEDLRFTCATAIVCAVLAGLGSVSALAQEPAAAAPPQSPRDLLKVFDIGEPFFDGFVDERPLDPAEREKLLVLLYRLRRMAPATMEEFSMRGRGMRAIRETPAKFRGEVISLSGYAQYVTREEIEPALGEKFEIDAWYRCQIVTSYGTPITLYALSVPQAWQLEEPIEERIGALAMFVKVLVPSGGDGERAAGEGIAESSLLFVAPRVAWYPNSLLGELHMDFGLFDDVRDRVGLNERECFYEMLAAVRRAAVGRIERAGRAQLAQRRDFYERLARNPHQSSKARAAAARALERAQQGADDVVPLFNEPAAERGKLFVLRGEALRAIEVRVDDPDIVQRFGIDRYYEVEIVTADSQNNPIVCCVLRLPGDMPLGESIHENVRVTGFFLKSWAFDSQRTSDAAAPPAGEKHKQLAPLLIGETVQVLGQPTPEPPSTVMAVALVAAIVLGAAGLWYARRGDRRALAKAQVGGTSLPQRIALDDDAADDAATT